MKPVVLGAITAIVLITGCGKIDTTQQANVDEDENIASVDVKTTIRGKKFAKNLTKATENIEKLTGIVKDDVTQVTGEAKRIASQVSAVTKDGVGVDVTLAPRTKPATEWDYHEVNATETDRKTVLAEQGRLGWELASERSREGGGFTLQLKRPVP